MCGAVKDVSRHFAGLVVAFAKAWPVTHQSSELYKFAPLINRRINVSICSFDYFLAIIIEKRISSDEQSVDARI